MKKLTRASQYQDRSKEGGVLLQVFPRQQHNLEKQNNIINMENRQEPFLFFICGKLYNFSRHPWTVLTYSASSVMQLFKEGKGREREEVLHTILTYVRKILISLKFQEAWKSHNKRFERHKLTYFRAIKIFQLLNKIPQTHLNNIISL